MTHEEIYAKLRTIAPLVVFSANKEVDPYFVWDGDCEEPDDMEAHNVSVTAVAIVGGKMIEGAAYLGGCYMAHDEAVGDCHGYLPQMLEEAASELLSLAPVGDWRSPLRSEIENAIAFLSGEMKSRYDEQTTAKA
jgi:hypothetical protein